MVDTSLALTLQTGRLPASDARDSGKVLPGGGADCRWRPKPQVRWALPSVRASRRGPGAPLGRQQRAPGIDVPASWARTATAGPECQGRRDFPTPGTVAPAWGCVRPGRPTEARHHRRCWRGGWLARPRVPRSRYIPDAAQRSQAEQKDVRPPRQRVADRDHGHEVRPDGC